MNRQRLVCAYCAGPVAEGRCPVCRQLRSELRSGWSPSAIALMIVALLALVAALLVGALLSVARATA
jgi:hypothetical protein